MYDKNKSVEHLPKALQDHHESFNLISNKAWHESYFAEEQSNELKKDLNSVERPNQMRPKIVD